MSILLVDDDAVVRKATAQWLELAGLSVHGCADAESALTWLAQDDPDVIVSDVKMPGMDGLALTRTIVGRDPDLPVVLITGHGDVAMAVQAMRDGAYDFIEKPFSPERLLETIHRASEKRRLVVENRQLRRQLSGRQDDPFAALVGNAPAMLSLRRQLATLAGLHADVLLLGETGTGKDRVARCLHAASPRAGKPFVAVNCAAIPESIAESELFGHEAGSFTGARQRRVGKFEHAQGGTLFLDEIESMPLALQAKVLRALQEREIERLGSNQPVRLDIRVLAATKVDLAEASRAGAFRADLYYRINMVELSLPPLRERREDIPLLFQHLVSLVAGEREPPVLDPVAMDRLLAHDWPGNVRELRNVAERYAMGLGLHIPGSAALPAAIEADDGSFARRVHAFERQLIEDALRRHHGEVRAVLDELGLPRRTLNDKMNRLGIDRRRVVDDRQESAD